MNLTGHPEYRAAIFAATRGDHVAARAGFGNLVAQARTEGDIETLGFLLHNLGEVEARAGNHDQAHLLYREAISLDPLSPQPLLFYAQSLLRAFGRPGLVEEAIQEAEQRLNAPAWGQVPQELPRSYYEREFQLLREELRRAAP